MALTMCKSPLARLWALKGGMAFTTTLALCAIWCKTICCNCSRLSRWKRPLISTQPMCAMRKSKCCGLCAPWPRMRWFVVNMALARSAEKQCQAMKRISANLQMPRHLSRSRRMSTIGAGKACPFTCALANACLNGAAKSSSSLNPFRTISLPSAAASLRPIGW